MKSMLTLVLSVALNVSAFAGGQSASPLIGTWKVDVSRLPIPPEARPKQVTISFGDAGADKRTMLVSIVDASGQETKAQSVYSMDGKPVPLVGTPEADTGALEGPSPDVLILALTKGGVGASTRVYVANPNGKEMVETAVYFSKDGSPIMRTNYFSRVE